MAVTSIWPIKGRVDKVINYARNPEKTHDKENSRSFMKSRAWWNMLPTR